MYTHETLAEIAAAAWRHHDATEALHIVLQNEVSGEQETICWLARAAYSQALYALQLAADASECVQ